MNTLYTNNFILLYIREDRLGDSIKLLITFLREEAEVFWS